MTTLADFRFPHTASVVFATLDPQFQRYHLDRDRSLEDHLARFGTAVYFGALDGSGNATIPHGIPNAHLRLAGVQFFYKGTSGEAKPLTITSVDGTNIVVSGGAASAAYRGAMIVMLKPVVW